MTLRAAVRTAYTWLRGMMSDDGYIAQAAAVPFRVTRRGRVEVLLIRRRGKRKWGIPKGLIDPGHTPRQAALIESEEEAGIEGALVGRRLGRYTYEKFGGTCLVTVYALRVTAEREKFLEQRSRERQWFPLDEAARTVAREDVGEMIRDLAARLK
jgi:8-oxo-dGTP pyrophosphatase MutT (NUDIX family)